jgi:alkylation response protein AidB-like acyl-CoA dehydrogenase
VDFTDPPEADAFRHELRTWLDDHVTDEVRTLGRATSLDPGSERLERLRAWNRALADAGYAAIAWPREYGGRGAGVLEQVVWDEELHRAGAPGPINVIGIPNVAPAIMAHGTSAQQTGLLPRMRRGDDIWCQGFSEPDAGSDLASLRTRAVRDGDDWVVTGQKIWTTLGQVADWCELLVRTSPEAPKHHGISCLLVDLDRPGVDVRPLVTITGEREFNEIFFEDVRVPVDQTLGPVDDGWRVAMTTLAHERGGVARLHLGLRAKVQRLLELARSTPLGDGRMASDDPALRQRLARAYLHAELLKLLSDRAISRELHGRPLGPEGSLAKLVWSETEQLVAEVSGEVLGPDANSGEWGRDRVMARSHTIAGGTTQVNKNIIATRILGLPRA